MFKVSFSNWLLALKQLFGCLQLFIIKQLFAYCLQQHTCVESIIWLFAPCQINLHIGPCSILAIMIIRFLCIFLAFLVFGPADSTIWWSFNWNTQWCFFGFVLVSRKPNPKTLFSPNFVRLKQMTQSIRNFTHCFIFDSFIVNFYDKQFREETKVLWTASAFQSHVLF